MQENVILVKAPQDSDEEDKYCIALKNAGLTVFRISPIEFQLSNTKEVAECLAAAEKYAGLILTSTRSVESLSNCVNLEKWSNKHNFVVGPATYLKAQFLGLHANGQESGSASELCKIISKGAYDKPFLYPKSNLANEAIEIALSTAGVTVQSIEAYRTIPSSSLDQDIQSLIDHLPAKIVFFSPSGVHNVLPRLKSYYALNDLEFFAIGGTTANALKEYDVVITGIADKPTPASLLSIIQKELSLR